MWACAPCVFKVANLQECKKRHYLSYCSALGILDRGHLNAQGLQRLTFLADLKENNVELVVCQGPGFVDGPEGQIVELALAVGKERSVLRAQTGAKQGLSDRVRSKGLPPTNRPPLGFGFVDGGKCLAPTKDWDTAALIWKLVFRRVLSS